MIFFEEDGCARDTSRNWSVKKTPIQAGYARFDTEKNERHHADKFWSLALAVHGAGLGKKRRRRGNDNISVSIV